MGNACRLLVDKDESDQIIRIVVEGVGVFEGRNLGGKSTQFPVSIKPMLKKLRLGELNHVNPDRTLGKMNAIPNTMLIIVDTYDWAWDIASRELLKAMPDIKGKIASIDDYRKENPLRYNVVIAYPWGAPGLMDYLDPRNTVICIAGGEQLDQLQALRNKSWEFNFYGACNKKIQARLKKEFPAKTVFNLIHGVDTNLFSPAKKRDRKDFVVGWVGSTKRGIKRYPLAVEIADKGGFKLRVAAFKQYPHDKMPRVYRGMDVLLVTSVTEAHPLIVYEAMACGLSVVATDVGDISQYITSGKNGFILPVNASITQFIEVINRLKKDAKLRTRIGENARQTVVKRLSWNKIAKQYTPLMKLMEVKK